MRTVPDQREDVMPSGFAYGLIGAMAAGIALWAIAVLLFV